MLSKNLIALLALIISLASVSQSAQPCFDGDIILFHQAVVDGDITAVGKCLAEGMDVNAPGIDQMRALHWASMNGDMAMMELLLNIPGIEVNSRDDRQISPLMFAASNGEIEAVERLLRQDDIELAAQDEFGNTALVLATRQGDVEIVKLLLPRMPFGSLNSKGFLGATALHEAIQYGADARRKGSPNSAELERRSTEIVRLLLDKPEINLDQTNGYEVPPLIWAVAYRQADIVRLILKKASARTVNFKTAAGTTALSHARQNKLDNIVQMLLEAGAVD